MNDMKYQRSVKKGCRTRWPTDNRQVSHQKKYAHQVARLPNPATGRHGKDLARVTLVANEIAPAACTPKAPRVIDTSSDFNTTSFKLRWSMFHSAQHSCGKSTCPTSVPMASQWPDLYYEGPHGN